MNPVINTNAFDEYTKNEFISIQTNRYRNIRNNILKEGLEPLITDISSNTTGSIKIFAETIVRINDDDMTTLDQPESFFIVQLMEYIDRSILYSRSVIRIVFNLQSHRKRIKICVKRFGKHKHGGACDFDSVYSFKSFLNTGNKYYYE